jgi:hypothetical protein
MAEDASDDKRESDGDDNDDPVVPVRRQTKALSAHRSAGSVENALDDFIIQAKQKTLDVSEFTPETREKQLREEIAELKRKLAQAEERNSEREATTTPGRPWGAIVGAFALGAAAMFGFHLATKSDRPAPVANAPTTTSEPSPPHAPQVPPTPPETPATAALPPETGSSGAPTPPTPQTTATNTTAQVVKPPPTKPGPNKTKPVRRPPPPGDGAAKPSSPPAAGSGSGDLYNPF